MDAACCAARVNWDGGDAPLAVRVKKRVLCDSNSELPATRPTPGDHNYVRASAKFFSVAVRGGGGPVLVLPYSAVGKLPHGYPTVSATCCRSGTVCEGVGCRALLVRTVATAPQSQRRHLSCDADSAAPAADAVPALCSDGHHSLPQPRALPPRYRRRRSTVTQRPCTTLRGLPSTTTCSPPAQTTPL